MDPSAMDFVMHRSAASNRGALSPMALDHQHSSPCPALRAAAEQGQMPGGPVSSRGGSGYHYDPVHSISTGSWWQHHPAQDGWQHPPYAPYSARSVPHAYPPPFPAPPGLIPPSGTSQANAPQYSPPFNLGDNFSPHGHPHIHGHSPPSFPPRPMMPGLDRIGGSAPTHHTHNAFEGSPLGGTDANAPRPGRLPTLQQITFRISGNPPAMDTDPSARAGPSNGQSRPSEAENTQAAPRETSHGTSATPPVSRVPPEPIPEGPRISARPPRNRRSIAPMSASEPSSDEDSDSNDPEISPLRMLESISAGGTLPALAGSDGGLRAAQLLRGQTTGKRVASKKALASLESVKFEDLPENERTCIICYNDFGTETPEGINEAPLRLPKCKHVFGDHCIKKWFEESDSCPYCRDKLPSEAQYRHVQGQALMQLMRHQTLQAFRQSRDAAPRDRSGDSASGSPFSLLPDPYENSPHAGHRRSEGLPTLRVSGWQNQDRRSPPGDFGEGRRRTRARHSSLRGSPPSARSSNHYGPSMVSGQSLGPFGNGGGRPHTLNHAHRHSVAFGGAPIPPRPSDAPAFEPNIPAPPYMVPMSHYQHSAGGLPPVHYLNPLVNNEAGPFRPGWPPARPQHAEAVPAAVSGPEIDMADSDTAVRNAAS